MSVDQGLRTELFAVAADAGQAIMQVYSDGFDVTLHSGAGVIPGAERAGIMQPQHFEIGEDQAARFGSGQHFGERRDISAGENIFLCEGVGLAWPAHARDTGVSVSKEAVTEVLASVAQQFG